MVQSAYTVITSLFIAKHQCSSSSQMIHVTKSIKIPNKVSEVIDCHCETVRYYSSKCLAISCPAILCPSFSAPPI